jgi:hypothetical protein|tara:strand:+ start:4042 stop:4227 length:186 start_codon:yes stop_codon:yes gene_type:complete
MLTMRPDISIGLGLECLPTSSTTEVIDFVFVSELINCGAGADLHATNQIFVTAFVSFSLHY